VVDVGCGLCFQAARLWTRLDLYRRIELQPLEPGLAADSCGAVVTADGQRYEHEPAVRKLLGVLPLGPLLTAAAFLLRPLSGPALRWCGRNREWLSRELALAPARSSSHEVADASLPTAPVAPVVQRLQRAGFWVSQLAVLALIVVAGSQVLVENPTIPRFLRTCQTHSMRVAVEYLRLNQGWSMFAPDAPTSDEFLVVDAVTIDGRHVDPWNDLASRVSDPSLRTIPERLAQDAAYCDYGSKIPGDDVLHEPLRNWIMSYHLRTHRANDQIIEFKAYAIEHDSPRPGETAPRNVQARVFLDQHQE
jgi:hypothetical protein